jgi:hypothetical protein
MFSYFKKEFYSVYINSCYDWQFCTSIIHSRRKQILKRGGGGFISHSDQKTTTTKKPISSPNSYWGGRRSSNDKNELKILKTKQRERERPILCVFSKRVRG